MKVRDKVIVLTGAGNGIGRELAFELLRRGASVAALDKNAASLQETECLAREIGPRLIAMQIDVTDEAEVARVPSRVCAEFGTVDGLINCAGIMQPFAVLQDPDDDAIDRAFEVNVLGKTLMIEAFLPHLLRRPEAHIVNVAGMGGILAIPEEAIHTSKAPVKRITEALYAKLAGTSVHLTLVLAGKPEKTHAARNSNGTKPDDFAEEDRRRCVITPRNAAWNIIEGVEKNRHRVLVQMPAGLMDVLYRLSPRCAADLVARQMQDMMVPNSSSRRS
jgi:NAD(P)-dependent dehydrogenase (short-subunit alcohol dehydrogenase family)